MKLIPPTITRETVSEGERRVFDLFSADTAHGDWVVFHSLDVAQHRRQMQGEIDFLVVAPTLGVLVLEVKGCYDIHRSDGVWYYGTSLDGDSRGPFRQASEAMHSVRDRLVRHHPGLAGVPFFSAACFPFLSYTKESPEWHPWQVIDAGKLEARAIGECVATALLQGRERTSELREPWFDASAGEPTSGQCEEIAGTLRPDFEFFESPKARARRVDEEIKRYTEEQFDALDHMARTPRVVFDGPAGTGKTVLALEAARRASNQRKRVLLLCFNRPLGQWLQGMVSELSGVTAVTLHEYMRGVAGVTPPQGAGQSYWDVELPELAGEALVDAGGQVEELIVDEAQDVLRDAFRDVLDLSFLGGLRDGTWRMFGDFANQAIYHDSVSLDSFCRTHGAGCAVYGLEENCRNTPRVADLACTYGGVARGYSRVLRPDDGVQPDIRFYGSADEQQATLMKVLEGLRGEGFTGPQVAILSTRSDVGSIAGSLSEPPWCDRLEALVDDVTHEARIDSRTGKMRFSSIHRFKGLEARAIVLTDVESLSAPRDRSLIYVGATRATHRLVILVHDGLKATLRAAQGGA